jgi:small subunit ribosomal protein S6
MRDYEVTILLKPTLSEKELAKEEKAVFEIFEKVGAKISKKLEPVKKNLAYEIAKLREAFYVYFEAEVKPEELANVEQKLKLQENIVRYLIVKSE